MAGRSSTKGRPTPKDRLTEGGKDGRPVGRAPGSPIRRALPPRRRPGPRPGVSEPENLRACFLNLGEIGGWAGLDSRLSPEALVRAGHPVIAHSIPGARPSGGPAPRRTVSAGDVRHGRCRYYWPSSVLSSAPCLLADRLLARARCSFAAVSCHPACRQNDQGQAGGGGEGSVEKRKTATVGVFHLTRWGRRNQGAASCRTGCRARRTKGQRPRHCVHLRRGRTITSLFAHARSADR